MRSRLRRTLGPGVTGFTLMFQVGIRVGLLQSILSTQRESVVMWVQMLPVSSPICLISWDHYGMCDGSSAPWTGKHFWGEELLCKVVPSAQNEGVTGSTSPTSEKPLFPLTISITIPPLFPVSRVHMNYTPSSGRLVHSDFCFL